LFAFITFLCILSFKLLEYIALSFAIQRSYYIFCNFLHMVKKSYNIIFRVEFSLNLIS
jgi:hypothetical protein